MKWFRIVSQKGLIWVNGIQKKNFQHPVPENFQGYLIIRGDEEAKFISDKDMDSVEEGCKLIDFKAGV